MPRSASLTLEKVLDEAVVILARDGIEGLKLATLARRLGIKTPSLYNHISGLSGLLRALRLRALRELKEEMQSAAVGRSRRDALVSTANAYRDYALNNPPLYRLTLSSTEGDDPEVRQAGNDVVEIVFAVLAGYSLEGEDAVHGARILRSALHGFVSLETADAYATSVSIDRTYDQLLEFLHQGLLVLGSKQQGDREQL